MKKILAFGASSSKNSINKKLAMYASGKFDDADVELLDLNDYEMPIYSVDREKADGIPDKAMLFASKIDSCDLLIISFAEHNGAYSTAFKNIFDWVSRIPGRDTWGDKDMLLLSTSPGKRGGATVLEIAKNYFPHCGGNIIGTFSLPDFYHNFDENKGIIDEKLNADLEKIIKSISGK
jgi:chromate reductase, NAD(P)H dehydrogenase (quinone)